VGQVSFIEQVLAFLLLLLLLIFCLIHHHPYIFFYYCYSSSYFVNFSSKLAMWLCGQWRICSETLALHEWYKFKWLSRSIPVAL
jgi:hypothetical protein